MKINGSAAGEVNYLIPISNGLLCAEHRKRIGIALWEFECLIDKITEEENGWGKVLGGKPISYSEIAKDLGVSERTVAANCRRLEKEGYIRMDLAPHGNKFWVAKSKKFTWKRSEESCLPQGERSEESCLPQGSGRKKTSTQVGRKLPTYIDNKADSKKDSIGHFGFAKFWEQYPKKKAKKEALKAFGKINPDEQLLCTILDALEKQKRSEQWRRDGGKFIPHGATWLNGCRWEDETETSPARQSIMRQADNGNPRGLDLPRIEAWQ